MPPLPSRIRLAVVALLTVLPGCRSDPPTTQPTVSPATAPAVPPASTTRSALPDNRTLDTFSYSFSPREPWSFESGPRPALFGPGATFSITRKGKVHYTYASAPHTGSGGNTIVKEWHVPPEEAARLLDGLVADGLLDAESGIKYTGYSFTVSYGRWQLSAQPSSMPAAVIERLRPCLEKGRTAPAGTDAPRNGAAT
jgi:hypothetical protein